MGARTPERVEIRVLGPFELSIGGRRAPLSGGRQRVMLAVLAMSAGQPVSVDRLVDAVWSERLPADGRRSVHTYITRLRATIGADVIATEPAGYRLRVDPDDVDALRFRRLVEKAASQPADERAMLAEALDLWRGAPFDGLASTWLHGFEASRLEERRLTALERRAEIDIASGRAVDVVADLSDLVSEHPLREPLWARLLLALARTGRQAEALERYEVVRSRIADELGVDPGSELRQIHSEIVTGVGPSAVGAPPPPAAEPVLPRQLPTDIAYFSGRTGALTDLDALAIDGGDRPTIVAVYGTGGVGKTSLVIHWAHRAVDRFPDGQLYVNLRGYGPGEPMPAATGLDMLLRGLGVAAEEIPSTIDARASLLRSLLADRRALVILDNVRDADQVRPLLPGSGRSVVVVTSRSQLRGLVAREGARRLRLDQLDPAESRAFLQTALGGVPAPDDRGAVAELAELCGHLPLALSIAAERVGRGPELGLTELVEDLRAESDRLDALDSGEESADLRAVFAWSYRALDDAAARMFRLLGLHAGSDLIRPAAAALAAVSSAEARRLLDRLVDSSLLQQRRAGRYELHDLLRAYAVELCEKYESSAERDAALDRLLGWYLGSMSNASHTLLGVQLIIPVTDADRVVPSLEFESPGQALAWMEAERHVVAAAARDAVRRGRHRTTYLLVFSMSNFMARGRAFTELAELLQLAQGAAADAGDGLAEAQATRLLGMSYNELLQDELACHHLELACRRFAELDHDRGLAMSLTSLGQAHQTFGRPSPAVDCYRRALTIQARLDMPQDESVTLNNLAMACIDLGRYDEAEDACRRALDIVHRHGPESDEPDFLDTLGRCFLAQGRNADAIDAFERALDRTRHEGDRWREGVLLTSLGRALQTADRLDAARTTWQQALDLFDEIGAPDGPEFSRPELVELLAGVEPTAADPA
jgi:DNA-binding SARP family transcriptional activator/tetratricopeptide (TPR) repeat protein